MSAPPESTSPELPGGVTVAGMLVGGITLAVWGGLLLLFGRWLLDAHAAALGLPPSLGALFSISAMFPALVAMYGCRRPGWSTAVMAFLVASVIAVVLAANAVAAAVVLWAIHPAAATGVGGFVGTGLVGPTLSLPVVWGAMTLLHRRQASDLPRKEWLRNENFRKPMGLGVALGLAAFVGAQLAGDLLKSWLVGTYPAAQEYHFGAAATGVVVMLTFILTGPSALRSVLRSLLAALVVFEVATAAAITAAVLVVTLQSDSLWLATAGVWLAAPVFLGAVLLVAHRADGSEDKTPGTAGREPQP